MNQIAVRNKIEISCAVCKFANHSPGLGNSDKVVCTLNPNKPSLKETNDTCLKHELKFKSLKIIEDKGVLLEYDTEKEEDREISTEEYESNFIEDEKNSISDEIIEEEIPW